MRRPAALLATAILFFGSIPASAAPLILSCQGNSGAPFVIKIDLDNKTVSNGSDGNHHLYRIQVTNDQISWNENPYLYFQYDLSRVTGNLHVTGIPGTPAAGAATDYSCHKTKNQF